MASDLRWFFVVCAMTVAGCRSPAEDGAGAPDASARSGPKADTVLAVEDLRARFRLRGEAGDVSAIPDPAAERIDLDGDRLRPRFAGTGLHRAEVALPARADGAFEVRDVDSGMSLRARLAGARGAKAEIANGYVVYRGAQAGGAALLHRATDQGTEDYIELRERPAGDHVEYPVELGEKVAGLRLAGNVLEFLDSGGVPRLRTAPPYLVDSAGAKHPATIAIPDCAADRSIQPPWGRAVTPPGNRTCTVQIGWLSEVRFPALLDPVWTTTGQMSERRMAPSLTSYITAKGEARALAAGGNLGNQYGGLSATTFPAGSTPDSVARGDINGDGKMDLVVANYTGNSVSLLLGKGDGTFQTPTSIPTGGTGPRSILIADMNANGKPDLVTANLLSQDVSVLLDDGMGGFQPAQRTPAGKAPWALAVGDLDKNGIPDLAVAENNLNNYSDGEIGVLLGTGGGKFKSVVLTQTGDSYTSLQIGDVNNDGWPDIVSVIQSGRVYTFINDKKGNVQFGWIETPYRAGNDASLLLRDLNGDGILDLVTAISSATTVTIRFGRIDGTFPAVDYLDMGIKPISLGASDIDGDGRDDLVVASGAGNNIAVSRGDGAGHFQPSSTYPVGINPMWVATGDVNGDGADDIATANYGSDNVSVLLNVNRFGSHAFRLAGTPATDTKPLKVAIGDWNRDGKPDLAAANYGSNDISIHLGNGDGTFAPLTRLVAGTHPITVIAVDWKGTGDLGLAVTNEGDNTVWTYFGDGKGGFNKAGSYPVGVRPFTVAAGHLNDDSLPDLVTTDQDSNTVSVLLATAPGVFSPAVASPTGGKYPVGLGLADVDRDGSIDIVVSNWTTLSVGVLRGLLQGGRKTGTFGPLATFAVGDHPNDIALGDFDRDGNLDIATPNQASSNVSVLLANGIGGFKPQTLYRAGSGCSASKAVDVNQDGRLDLLVINQGGSVQAGLSVLYGLGDGRFLLPENYGNGSQYSTGLDVADLNRDGRIDLVIANSGWNNLGIMLGAGTVSASEQFDFDTHTWSVAGQLITPRQYHAAFLDQPSSAVLVTGGTDMAGVPTGATEWFDPSQGIWSTAGSLRIPRRDHTATYLPQIGKTLVAGGSDGTKALASWELFDHAKGQWTATGPIIARANHTATLLRSGSVLIAGGADANGTVATAEIYDAGVSNKTDSLNPPRTLHTATLLPDGRVLIAGGENKGSAVLACQVYDPATGKFSAAGSLQLGRRQHGAGILPNGAAFVTGGIDDQGNILRSTELYDSIANQWVPGPNLNQPRASFGLTGFDPILIAGGRTGASVTNTAELLTLTPIRGACKYDVECGLTQKGTLGYCENGICTPRKDTGQPCARAGECASLFCADGVCCNAACAGGCEACAVRLGATSDGQCTLFKDKTTGRSCAPYLCDGVNRTCPMSCSRDDQCIQGDYCSVLGTCLLKKGTGVPCQMPQECASGTCADGFCCDGGCTGECDTCSFPGSEGHCLITPGASGTPSCAPYLCGAASTCPASCAADSDCVAMGFCDDATHRCAAKKRDTGQRCRRDGECTLGHCADGFCCNSACSEQCGACNLPGSVGLCSVVKGPPVGDRPPCGGAGGPCGLSCNGVDMVACTFADKKTQCAPPVACGHGEAREASFCDGMGNCPDGAPIDCCAGGACVDAGIPVDLAGTQSATDGPGSPRSPHPGCSCRVGQSRSDHPIRTIALLLGVLLLRGRRRRSS